LILRTFRDQGIIESGECEARGITKAGHPPPGPTVEAVAVAAPLVGPVFLPRRPRFLRAQGTRKLNRSHPKARYRL
jgi:hypothetical protein